jgi:hypothetical protein
MNQQVIVDNERLLQHRIALDKHAANCADATRQSLEILAFTLVVNPNLSFLAIPPTIRAAAATIQLDLEVIKFNNSSIT